MAWPLLLERATSVGTHILSATGREATGRSWFGDEADLWGPVDWESCPDACGAVEVKGRSMAILISDNDCSEQRSACSFFDLREPPRRTHPAPPAAGDGTLVSASAPARDLL
jgi:hypothetical protein